MQQSERDQVLNFITRLANDLPFEAQGIFTREQVHGAVSKTLEIFEGKISALTAEDVRSIGEEFEFFPPAEQIAEFRKAKTVKPGGKEEEEMALAELDELKQIEKKGKTEKEIKGMKAFNIFKKSNLYVNNSPKMTDESRAIHDFVVHELWHEVHGGVEPVPRKDLYRKGKKTGVIKTTAGNFITNFLGQVKLAMDFFLSDDEARKNAEQKLKEGSKSAVLLKKLYDDGFRTLDQLVEAPNVKPGEDRGKPQSLPRETRPRRGKKVAKRKSAKPPVARIQPPAPVAGAMVNGTLAAAMAQLDAEIVALQDKKAKLLAAEEVLKNLKR